MSLVAIAVLFLGSRQNSLGSPEAVARLLGRNGFKYVRQQGYWNDALVKGSTKVGFRTSPFNASSHSMGLWLSGKMLPAGSVDSAPVEELLKKRGFAERFEILRYINDELEIKCQALEVHSDQELLVATKRFFEAYEAAVSALSARRLAPREELTTGHHPANNRRIEGLSWAEACYLEQQWHWGYKPHPLNETRYRGLRGGSGLGMASSQWTVDDVEVQYTVGMERWGYLTLCADLPVEKGVDVKVLVSKLNRGKFGDAGEGALMERLVADADSGKKPEWFAVPFYGEEASCYTLVRHLSVKNLTLGALKTEVKGFAAKVKGMLLSQFEARPRLGRS